VEGSAFSIEIDDWRLAAEVTRSPHSRMTVSSPPGDLVSSPLDSGTRWHRRPANRPFALLLQLVFAAVGIFFVVSGYNSWAAVQPIASGKMATGNVVSVVNGESCGRYGCSPNWTPTIRFETSSGESHTFVGPTYSSQINIGENVRVSYDAADPATAHDVSASAGNGLLLIGFGVFAAVLGLGSFLLGLDAIHRRTGLASARQGHGWVGHKTIHSNVGVVAAAGVVLALAAVGLLVI
jgi:Protein of unknown function (DUF3592)